jgi:parallel beta-helix repeat protein
MDSGISLANNDNCLITNNYLNQNDDYGIEITEGTDNLVQTNYFFSNGIAPITDAGTNTRMHVLTLPFTEGTTFLSVDGAAWGWEIDTATEYAIAIGALPPEVQQVVRWKIKAVTIVLEADAMRLQIDGYGGTGNEAWNTETIAVVDKNSDTTNFAANDYIEWVLTASDDADLDDMVGDDTIMVKVQHEAGDATDAATDAVFQCVEVHYV